MSQDPAWVPEACTLPTAEQPLRRAEFNDLFAGAVSIERPARLHARLRLAGAPDLASRVSDLASRESECCAFFSFTITPLPAGDVAFDIEVPAGHVDVLDALVARCAAQMST